MLPIAFVTLARMPRMRSKSSLNQAGAGQAAQGSKTLSLLHGQRKQQLFKA